MLREMMGMTAPTIAAAEHILGHYQRPYGGMVVPDGRTSANTLSGGPALDINLLYTMIGSGVVLFTCVYNMTGSEIVVVSRNGVRNIHKPLLGQYKGVVIVRNVHVVLDVNSPRLDKYFFNKQVPEHTEHEFQRIREAYVNSRKGPTACFNSNEPRYLFVISDAIIQESALDKHTSIYVNNRDLVLSIADVEAAPNHPFDDLETSIEAAERILKNQIGSGLLYDIIDNKQSFGDRYALFGKNVVRIPARIDLTREDGVYIYQAVIVNDKREIVAATYKLSDAEEKLGLYRSEQDAITGGDARVLREQELESLKHDNKIMQAQIQKNNMEREEALLEYKSHHSKQELLYKEKISELEKSHQLLTHRIQANEKAWEIEKLQYQRQLDTQTYGNKFEDLKRRDFYDDRDYNRKDYYESRSHMRRDATEELKFWPLAITAIVSAAAGAAAVLKK